ncbi:MAG: hypothetical protein ACRC14_16625 [Paracoccaceae bacterium]
MTIRAFNPFRPHRILTTGLRATLSLCLATTALAQTNPPANADRRGPPPEALAACAGQEVKAVCSMTIPNQTAAVHGECAATPDNQIACLPEGAKPPTN